MPEKEVSGTARIDASADELYELVSDVTRMGEWSPENTGGRWLGGQSAATVGARFSGANRRGWRRWSTICKVVAAEPGRKFSFDVSFAGIRVSSWTYAFRSEADATLVTETWVDRRPGWFALTVGSMMGIDDLRVHHEENIRKTLANLKAAAEGAR